MVNLQESEEKMATLNSVRIQRHNSGNLNLLQITNNLKNDIISKKISDELQKK